MLDGTESCMDVCISTHMMSITAAAATAEPSAQLEQDVTNAKKEISRMRRKCDPYDGCSGRDGSVP